MAGSPTLYDESYADKIKNVSTSVIEVLPNSPADESGVFVGDAIQSITFDNGKQIIIDTPEDILSAFQGKGVEEVDLEILRKGEVLRISVTPEYGLHDEQEHPLLGVALGQVGTLRLPLHEALWEGLERTWHLTTSTAEFLVDLVKGLIQGDRSEVGSITGPIGIVPVVGNALEVGFSFVVIITALISINLAIINLLPFPALDGGRLLFVLIEAIKGSPINPKTSSWLNGAGFFILILLMVIVTIRDIVQLF